MTLLGSYGKVQTPYFDDPNRDDFIRGAADKFVFSGLNEVGEIHCIELSAGGDDSWLFDSVSKHLNRIINFGQKDKTSLEQFINFMVCIIHRKWMFTTLN